MDERKLKRVLGLEVAEWTEHSPNMHEFVSCTPFHCDVSFHKYVDKDFLLTLFIFISEYFLL